MTLVDLNPDLAFFVLRLALGIVFLAHGPEKLTKTKQMASGMGVSVSQVTLIGVLETLGAASLILGLWMQVGSVFLAIVMLGAIYMKTQKWGKKFTGEMGWELDFMVLAAIIAVFLGAPDTYMIFG